MTRRDFHHLTGTAVFGLAASSRVDAGSYNYPWKLGIITDEVDPDLSVALSRFYPKYQLHWAEIRNLTLDGRKQYVYNKATPAQLKQVRKQLDDANVKLSVLDTGVYKITLPGTTPLQENGRDLNPVAGEYERQLDDLKRAGDAAHALGTDRVRIFTFMRVADPSAIFNRITDDLQKAIGVAKQQGITLLVENEFDCNVGTGKETAQLFKTISDRTLMHNWDPGNCFEAGEQPYPQAWDQLDHSRIVHVHLKDAEGKSWKPIGAGKIDFAGQFSALKKMNYKGTLSLETHYLNPQKDIYTSSVESMDGLVTVLKRV